MTELPDWSSLKVEKNLPHRVKVWKAADAPHQLYYTADSPADVRNSTPAQKLLEYSYARGQRLQHPNLLTSQKYAKEYRDDYTRSYLRLDISQEAKNRFSLEKIPAVRFVSPGEQTREISWAYHLLLALAYLHDREFAYNDFSFDSVVVAGTYAFLPLLKHAVSLTFLARQKYGYVEETEVRLDSLCFRPPETMLNLQRKESIDPRKNDIWACGVFVYWIATGEMPFGSTDEETLVVYSDWSRYSFEVVGKAIEHKIDNLEVHYNIKNFLYRTLALRPASRASARDLLAEELFADVQPLAKSQPDTDFQIEEFLDKLPQAPPPSPEAASMLAIQQTGFNVTVTAGFAAQILGKLGDNPSQSPERVLAANIIAAEFTQSQQDLEHVQFALERLGVEDRSAKMTVLELREQILQTLRYDIWGAFPEMYVTQLESGEEQGRLCAVLALLRILGYSQEPKATYQAAQKTETKKKIRADVQSSDSISTEWLSVV